MSIKDNADGGRGPRIRPGGVAPDLGLLLMAVIWGVNFPVIKAALAEIPPMAFNALRFPLASLTVLVPVVLQGKLPWPHREDLPRILALGIVGNVVYQGFFILGLDATLAGNASILLSTIPVWTLVFSAARGHESPPLPVWLGVGATTVGMVSVVLGGELSVGLGQETLVGDLLILSAAATWAAYAVGARKVIRKYGSVAVTAWTLWIGSVVLILAGFPELFSLELETLSFFAGFGVAYAGVMAIGLAYLLWNRGVKQIGSSRTAVYQNLVPVVALALAWAWLGERPGVLQLAGAGVILVGVTVARRGGQGEG